MSILILYYFWYLTFTLPSPQFLSPPVNTCKFCFHIHVSFPQFLKFLLQQSYTLCPIQFRILKKNSA